MKSRPLVGVESKPRPMAGVVYSRKEVYMNQRCHEEIARDAWTLFKKAQHIEQSLLDSFIDDFMDFETQERAMKITKEDELPF